ncbi:MAG: TetR/AcrR family transcriptional regulator, partial [Candidatus Poribacteria bacterium]|nr:TetR/AcrR family transcriptional regulator [Candidatus Poribacteria bacterium]
MSPFSRFYNLTDDKQKKILESAVSEFTQRGFDGASLNQIISTAGLSKGSFYYYFENKIDLLVGVLEAFFSPDFIIILDELKQSSDTTKFWSIFRNVSIKQVAKWFDNPWRLKLSGFIVGLPDHVTSSNQMTNYMEKW